VATVIDQQREMKNFSQLSWLTEAFACGPEAEANQWREPRTSATETNAAAVPALERTGYDPSAEESSR
jgi:hypothetical protein